MNAPYPIGTPGQPWTDAERAEWRARQRVERSYAHDVLAGVERLRESCEVASYGAIDHGSDGVFPLFALRSRGRREGTPRALITGGVHGYETSGVHGALQFAERHLADYDGRLDVIVVPCVSPWAYERVQRWNPLALDPNRSFVEDSPCAESAALMRLVAPLRDSLLVHVDLHETTDTDATEFRPAKAARDGAPPETGSIPDGFYLVGDTEDPQVPFQRAILDAVAAVTHLAPADADGQIIGSDVVSPGLILYPCRGLGLCAGVSSARYRTTTEVYPDSPRATPEQCNDAQVAAARAALDFALAAGG